METELSAGVGNGQRCAGELHGFIIGSDARTATVFRAAIAEFRERLTDAIIDHRLRHPTETLYIQVQTESGWKNIQNPSSGNVVAVTPEIVSLETECQTLFGWACNAVQIVRDCLAMSGYMAEDAVHE